LWPRWPLEDEMSFETQFNNTAKNVLDIQKRLMDIGNNHVKVEGYDDIQATTQGKFGRFCNWAVSFFTRSARNANEDVVSTLVAKIHGAPSFGSDYSELFKEKADALLAARRGRPISGRQIGRIFEETINQAKEAYVQTAIRRKKANEDIQSQLDERLGLYPIYYKSQGPYILSGFAAGLGIGPEFDSFPELLRGAATDLGISPAPSSFSDITAGLLPKVMETLISQLDQGIGDRLAFQEKSKEEGRATEGVILGSVMTGGLNITKALMKEVALNMYLRSQTDDLIDAMRAKHNLGDMSIDSEAFFKVVLEPAIKSLLNVEPLKSKNVDAALYALQDPNPANRLENKLADYASKLRQDQAARNFAPAMAIGKPGEGGLPGSSNSG
jgi:hypothetical protein